MSGFSADWLALREPFDQAGRAAAAVAIDWSALRRRCVGENAPLTVLDLACGTGANLRALAPRLGGVQRWLLIDNDPALLAAVPAALSAWAGAQGLQFAQGADRLQLLGDGLQVDIERRRVDIAIGLDALPWHEVRLVTASALLDLVSAPWLRALVEHCRVAGAAVLWALSVDARIEWSPPDASDAAVQALFTAHQRRGKGIGDGPALGPDATALAASLLTAAGYRVTQAASDWRIDATRGDAHLALLTAMVGGIAQAAAEQDATRSPIVAAWRARRLAQLSRTRLRVGHQDLIAHRPAEARCDNRAP